MNTPPIHVHAYLYTYLPFDPRCLEKVTTRVLGEGIDPGYHRFAYYATGHIKDPVPLIEKRRGLSPGGRFPPSFYYFPD